MITLTNGVQVPENAVQLQTTAAIDDYYVTQPLRLVQYDETLPVAAVQLTYQNQPYTPPTGAELNVRMGKPDGTTVYNPCLGMDSSGIVYFVFTQQMTIVAGTGTLTVEVTDSGVKNSAPIIAEIRPNPVPEGSIASTDEFLTLQEILAEAEKWGQIVQTNASNIQQVVDNLTDIQNAAENAQAAAASAAAAQQAAQEALGFRKFYSAVVPDANGNLDPSRPMTVGPASSLTIESKGDRIQSVTALGFTQQAGTGDPSPTNVRQLTNGGVVLASYVLDGSLDETYETGDNNCFVFRAFPRNTSDAVFQTGAYSSTLKATSAGTLVSGSNSGIAFSNTNGLLLRFAGITTQDALKAALQANPLTVWYPTTDGTGTLYAPIILQGGEYRTTCLPLTAPLCKGDSVVSWAKSGCDVELTLGAATVFKRHSAANTFKLALSDVENTEAAYSNMYASGVLGVKDGNRFNIVDGDLFVLDSGFSTAEEFNAHITALEAAGTPVVIWYRSTNYTEAADIPVSLETHQQAVLVLDGTESGWIYINQQTSSGTVLQFQLKVYGVKSPFSGQCSHYKPYSGSWASLPNFGCQIFGTENSLRIRDSNFESLDDFKAYLAAQYAAGTPVTIVYQLATPITYAHPAVVLEAATGDQLTYTVTGQSGGTVSVALKPFQDGGNAKTADNAANAQNADNATQFDGHAWSEVPGQAPVQSVNGKTGAVTLSAADVKARPDSWTPSAEDVGAIPKGHTKTLASGLAWKTGSINTPAGWDDYTMIQLSSNFGKAIIKNVPKDGSEIAFFVNNSDSYINATSATISRNSTGGSITLSNLLSLRLSTSGVTKNNTEFNIYQIEGIA